MQISAIVANYSQVMKAAISENYCNDETTNPNDTHSNADNCKKSIDVDFKSINEWKKFCHRQILNGKLDIIA